MIPLQVDLLGASEGTAVIIIGILSILLWCTVQFRNPLGAVMWGISVLVLLVSGVFGVGIELFWLSCMATVLIVIVGIAARTVN